MAFHVSLCAREKRMSTKTLVFTVAVLAGLAAICGTTPLFAQNPSFSSFTSTTNPVRNGSATVSNGVLHLNPAQGGQAGSAWFSTLQPVAGGFSTTFTFQISNPSTPSADGIAFVIQNSNAGLQALGDGGGGIGYQGITNSLAIEFDTYANPYDPEFPASDHTGNSPANHIAIQSCGTDANTADHTTCELSLATPNVNMADGQPHTVRIDYLTNVPPLQTCDGPCPTSFIQVTIGTQAMFEGNGVPVNLGSLLTLASTSENGPLDSAYVGFTAGTGLFFEADDILSWTFTPHTEQTITQTNLPAGQFTSFIFGSYLYKVRPDVGIDTLAVTEVPTDPGSFNAGTNFPTAQCIVYDSTGGKCIEFHAVCTGATCSNVNYDVVTSYDVPGGTILGPGFLKATDQDCVPGITFDSNIITAFLQTRTDPTTKGTSKPSFSCFVAVQNLQYGKADLDIVNLASSKVRQGANLTYVATTTNFGPSGAQGVAISNTIPAGTTYLSSSLCSLTNGCSNTQCAFAAGTASCTVGNLDKFGLEFMLVTVKVNAAPGTILSDTATISAFNPDPDTRPDRSWTTKTTVTK
jgi:uncharacterized repeat protein (TIGR01451 family)